MIASPPLTAELLVNDDPTMSLVPKSRTAPLLNVAVLSETAECVTVSRHPN
jgi:hypothetical protein